MRMKNFLAMGLLLLARATCMAGGHTWDVNEAFSNADGSIWFIELREAGGGSMEFNVVWFLTSTTNSVSICILSDGAPCNVSGNTSNKNILFGNPGYAELAAAQGAAPPDQVVFTSTFFSVAGDTLRYNPSGNYDTWIFGAVPVDGVMSMNRIGGALANTPRNYVGTGSGGVDASSPPPSVVPDGSGPGTPMTVTKLDSAGSSLRLTFDVSTCALNSNHQIIFGDRSDLPSSLGGTYLPSGVVCGIGGASPYTWSSTPNASDGSGLIWWLIVVNNDSVTEGSWGNWEDFPIVGGERQGPGVNGSSGLCGVTDKDLSNTCGS